MMRWGGCAVLPAAALLAALGAGTGEAAFYAPENLAPVPGNQAVALRWDQPVDANTLTAYAIERDGVEVGRVSGTPPATAYLVADLQNGQIYSFRVWGVAAGGNSQASSAVWSVPFALPAAPGGLTGTAQGGNMDLAWSAALPGTYPVAGYVLTRALSTTGPSDTVTTYGLSLQDTAVNSVSANSYFYRIAAHDTAGNSGPASAWMEVPVVEAGAASAPASLTLVPGDGALTARWDAVTGADSYCVYYTTDPVGNSDPHALSVTTTAATLSGLTNGAATTVFVSAVTGSVLGRRIKAAAWPSAVPGAVTGLAAHAGDGYVRLSWEPPSGVTVTAYTVFQDTVSPPGNTLTTLSGSETRWVDETVSNGQTYYYAVIAASVTGSGPPAMTAGLQPQAGSLPDAPQGVEARIGISGTVELVWQPNPAGDQVTGYIVTTSALGLTLAADAVTTRVAQGLLNGVPTDVGITAHNLSGSSQTVTITAAPLAPPTGFSGVVSANTVTLSWKPATAPNGADYRLSAYLPDGGSAIVLSRTAQTSMALGPLDNGTYFYALLPVSSWNGQASSGAASGVSLTVSAPPTPPVQVAVVAGDRRLDLYWRQTGATDADPPSYRLYRSTTPGAYGEPLASVIENTVTHWRDEANLVNLQTYYYVVTCVNTAGESACSRETAGIPFQPAGLPADSTVRIWNERRVIGLSWQAGLAGDYPILGYSIYRSLNGGAAFDLLGNSPTVLAVSTTVTAYAFFDTDIQYGNSYAYLVHAVDSAYHEGPAYAMASMNLQDATNRLSVFRNAFNPARGETVPIQIMVVQPGRVWVKLYTLSGRHVRTLLDDEITGVITRDNPLVLPPLEWDGRNQAGELVASGVYLVHVEIPGSHRQTRKIAVIK